MKEMAEHGVRFMLDKMWDHENEGFFYDVLSLPGERYIPLKVRSLVGLSTLFAVLVLKKELLEKLPDSKCYVS
mgnify:CR=1 FL=1